MIKERYYSVLLTQDELDLLQKEFGLKRAINAKIGHLRRDVLAPGFKRAFMEPAYRKANTAAINALHPERVVNNKKVRKALYEEAKNLNVRTVGINPQSLGLPTSFTTDKKQIDQALSNIPGGKVLPESYDGWGKRGHKYKERAKKTNKRYDDGKLDNLVIHENSAGDEFLGHEYGHVSNKLSKNKRERVVNYLGGGRNRVRHKAALPVDQQLLQTSPSMEDAWGDLKRRRMLIEEEGRASKKSLEWLREAGASKEEMDIAKKHLDDALENYKQSTKIPVLGHIYQKLQIPSRRHNLTFIRRDMMG